MAAFWKKDPGKMKDQAVRLAETGRWPEAIETLEAALRHIPKGGDPVRFEIEKLLKEYGAAHRAFLIETITRLFEEGNREKAKDLAEVAEAFSRTEAEREEIRALVRAHPRIDARKFEKPPTPDRYPPELVDSLLQGYIELADPVERRALESRPLSFQKAFVLWHQGEPEGAREAAEEYLSKRMDDPFGQILLGLSLLALGEDDRAFPLIETAAAADPPPIRALVALAGLERQKENRDRAADIMEKAVALVRAAPDDFGERRREEVYSLALQLLAEAERLDRAEELYVELREEKALEENLIFEANIHEVRGDVDEAAAAWNLLIGANPMSSAIIGHGSGSRVSYDNLEAAGDFFQRNARLKRALDLYRGAALLYTSRIHENDNEFTLEPLVRLKAKIALLLMETFKWGEAEQMVLELESIDPPPPQAAELRKKLDESWEEEETEGEEG
ncbi:MAG: hypothetical protein JW958_09480 [Candidatus Eisenbacteria bacterium]|nr:hypothetical protein [Candidatus Eisenbacteria bacterium]